MKTREPADEALVCRFAGFCSYFISYYAALLWPGLSGSGFLCFERCYLFFQSLDFPTLCFDFLIFHRKQFLLFF